jgi:holo-[acyl-carrier protein] synthase
MSIIGHGIDIVETDRIRRLVDEHGTRFLNRVFTSGEQAYCAKNPKRRFERLAVRFAAKEAVLKVLGTGKRGNIAWTDIEVTKLRTGQPTIRLNGYCAELAEKMRIARWHVSLSHVQTHAMASAIGMVRE